MAHLATLVQFLDETLKPTGFDDSSQNGLQVESSCLNIDKIGLAVDSGLSVLEQAVKSNCQLLLVHHGLFWGNVPSLSGTMGKKIRALIEGGCSLYASHLALDAHPLLGNNAEILRLLGAKIEKSFCRSGQHDIGYIGRLENGLSVDDFELKIKKTIGDERFLGLKFGKSKVNTVAVVSGGASFAVHEAHALGVDAFISGEPKQNIFHETKELEINAFFPGHYASEVFGVQAVGRLLNSKFGVSIEFIDQPTSI